MSEFHPRAPIRRSDVFAEYRRQEALAEGLPPDEAAGYGLGVAKVVDSRKFGRAQAQPLPSQAREPAARQEETPEGAERPRWPRLEGEAQTDALCERQIVARRGLGHPGAAERALRRGAAPGQPRLGGRGRE